MAKDTTDIAGKRSWLRGPRTRAGITSLVLFARTATFLVFAFICFVLVFFAALRMVPITMSFVMDGTGIGQGASAEALIAWWLAPSLFIIAMIFTLVVVVIRALWRQRGKVLAKVEAWAFAHAPKIAPVAGIQKTSSKKPRAATAVKSA